MAIYNRIEHVRTETPYRISVFYLASLINSIAEIYLALKPVAKPNLNLNN